MIKISKIADYGTSIMLIIAANPERVYAAKYLSEATKITLPMVSKILKKLAKGGLLASQRGSMGGYQLTVSPEQISVARLIALLDGDIAMTECSLHVSHCMAESVCTAKGNWRTISSVIKNVLEDISLKQMLSPISPLSRGVSHE
jgi:FeS assembly SUF system regulator